MFKNIFPHLLGIAGLFFININIAPSLFASTSKTKKITKEISNSPLLSSSINDFTKVVFKFRSPKYDNLSKGKCLPKCASQQVIDGLVLNNTLSREGYDFYILFTHYWTPPANAANFQIIIKEYAKAGRNTALAISLNDKELVYRIVTPSYNAINGLASAAANYLSTYLKNGNHLNGLEVKSNLKDVKSNNRRITSPFDVY